MSTRYLADRIYSVVTNVQWNPTYELHATTEDGKPSASVALHYRARITQSTGEDWTDTSLILSTVTSDTMVKKIPELAPIKIKPRNGFFQPGGFVPPPRVLGPSGIFQQSQQSFAPASTGGTLFGPAQAQPSFGPAPSQQQSQQSFASAPTGGSLFGQQAQTPQPSFGLFGGGGAAPSGPPPASAHPASDDQDFEDISTPVPITEPQTVVTETPVAISYSVHGKTTIPSDGIEHQVSVAVLPFEASVSYVAIPRIEPRVYLQVCSPYLY